MKSKYLYTGEIHNLSAPREVVPLVIQLVNPKSVLDVGCGTGIWLKVFEEQGMLDYIGVDGSHLSIDMLKIPARNFLVQDLREPFLLDRKFDLVISLEVAEHLEEQYAQQFVRTLISHGDTILFSAAIPGQGGQNHLNEQWPEYWQKKFEEHGFFLMDIIRPLIWKNEKIDWWYRQNIFLVTKGKPNHTRNEMISVVHPDLHNQIIRKNLQYVESVKKGEQGLRLSTKIFCNAILYKLKLMLGLI